MARQHVINVITSKFEEKTGQFPPIDGKAWLGVDWDGNVYLGQSVNFGKITHYFSCIYEVTQELGTVWTGEWLPKGLKPFKGSITLGA